VAPPAREQTLSTAPRDIGRIGMVLATAGMELRVIAEIKNAPPSIPSHLASGAVMSNLPEGCCSEMLRRTTPLLKPKPRRSCNFPESNRQLWQEFTMPTRQLSFSEPNRPFPLAQAPPIVAAVA
jgi:hypothetical protein